MKTYLLIKNIKIHNANALSSTISVGFPAMTAWLGGVHALQRKINEKIEFANVKLLRVAVCCHEHKLEVYRNGDSNYVLVGVNKPMRSDKKKASIIEDPRIHLTVSLLIEVTGISVKNENTFVKLVPELLQRMKLAGGDIIHVEDQDGKCRDQLSFCNKLECEICYDSGLKLKEVKCILNKLMPGYVLVERRDLIKDSDELKGLDRLLSYLKTYFIKSESEEGSYARKVAGWIVPIGVGFRGISKLGYVQDQRDSSKLHQFVEPIVTLGEFKMPYQVDCIDDILWEYQYKSEESLYLCCNQRI